MAFAASLVQQLENWLTELKIPLWQLSLFKNFRNISFHLVCLGLDFFSPLAKGVGNKKKWTNIPLQDMDSTKGKRELHLKGSNLDRKSVVFLILFSNGFIMDTLPSIHWISS